MRCGRALVLLVRRLLAAGAAGVALALAVSVAAPSTAAAESAQVRFAEPSLQAVESRGQVRVLVERVDLPVSRLLVHYRTEGVASSAEAGSDYAHTAGTLVFEVGARSGVFTVWVRDDDVAEETEHLLLHLETSSGTGASTRLTILDDDLPPAADTGATDDGAADAPDIAAARSGAPAPSGPVVVASSAGAARPVAGAVTVRRRASSASVRQAPPRRIILQQTPTTPFELRPAPGPFGASTRVDPLVALAAGLLLARVAAEVWFRTRLAVLRT